MAIPVQYFQVAAAAIPTLLIALAISGNASDNLLKSFGGNRLPNAVPIFLFGWLLLANVCGEFSALAALVSGRTTLAEAAFTFAGIWVDLLIIMLLFFLPIGMRLSDRVSSAVLILIGLLFGGGLLLFFGVVLPSV